MSPTTIRPDDTDGLPAPARRVAMLTITIAITLAVMSTVIANIALPTMMRELGTTPASATWVVNAYELAVTVTLLPLSALGDIVGYRLIYMGGLAMFTVASLACGFADSLPLLVAARVIQGFGAAGIMSVNIALVRFTFPRDQLGRAVGTVALAVATSSAAGPSVAAAILAVASWHWLFLFNVPLGVVALALGLRSLPRTPLAGHRFDWLSAVLNAATFGLLLLGMNEFGRGQNRSMAGVLVALGVVAGWFFIRRQKRLAVPMLPVDLFRKPVFALSVATSVCSYAAQSITYLALPFYFAIGGGMSQSRIGLLITPWPAVVMIVAPIAGRLSDRYPAGLLGGIGLVLLTIGLVLLNALPPDPAFIDVVWRMMIAGTGFGFFQSPNNRALIAAAPRSRSGVASGVLSTARLTGMTTGGVMVAVIFALLEGHVTQEVTVALGVAAGFSGVASVISFSRLGRA